MPTPPGERPDPPPFDPRLFEPRAAGAPRRIEPLAFEPPPIEPQGDSVGRIVAIALGALILLAAAGGAFYWWQQREVIPPVPAAAPPLATAPPASVAPPPAEPAIQHPIDVPAEAAARAPEAPDDAITRALADLLGGKAVTQWLQTDGLVRRIVATVDNLGRGHAPPQRWPVVPSPGRFSVVPRAGDGEVIAPANTARYEPFVELFTSVDATRIATLYKSHYPQFQAAYRELGYPRGYFNDRLVEVIDLMLATPEPAGPLAVRLTEVKGPITSDRPWVRYEFADPALEALPVGSKILLRMSPAQAARMKAQLRAVRAAVAATPAKN